MPRFIELTLCDGEKVIVNANKIGIIQEEDRHNRTKITINGVHMYVNESSYTIVRKSRSESGEIYLT